MIWNDPSVIKEAGVYRMWLSGGQVLPGMPIRVDTFHAVSTDRVAWTINPTPVLSPSTAPSDWDSLRVETPSVIRVGALYHMYYSGCDGLVFGCGEPGQNGNWALGHATSPDGFTWTRDPANPMLVSAVADPSRWGGTLVAEPGAFYNPRDGLIYVYVVGGKTEASGFHGAILVATSPDGSNMTWVTDATGEPMPALQAGGSYPLTNGWKGMTAPMVYAGADGTIHMFFDAFGPDWRQTSIGHAISDDGLMFTEADAHIAYAPQLTIDNDPGHGAWNDTETWAAAAWEEADGTISLWFAGKKHIPNVYFTQDIGLATGTPN